MVSIVQTKDLNMWLSGKLDVSGLAKNWVWIHSTGLQASYSSTVISSLPAEMSWLVEVHVAPSFGEKRSRRRLEAAEGRWVGGELKQTRRNTTADSGFSPLSRSLSLSSADSHTASLCCIKFNVHSSKLSLFPDFTPSPSRPANVSSASYWMHMATYAVL